MSLRRFLGNAALAAIRLLVYLLPLAIYILVLSVTNPYVAVLNRTSAITITSFLALFIVFMRVYGGFHIEQQKVRQVVYQATLSVFFTGLIVYFQIQIMNTNNRHVSNLSSFRLFGIDLALLLGILALQCLCFTVLAVAADRIYFRLNPPKSCLVVTNSSENIEVIRAKVSKYRRRFALEECVDYRDPNLHDKIRRCQSIVLFHLPANIHQELIEYCYKCDKNIFFDLNIGDILAQNSNTFLLDDVVMTAHTRSGLSLTQRIFKRALDLFISGLGMIVLSPVMGAVALAIKLDDHGKVIYKQDRMTLDGRIFQVYKFRTMREEAGSTNYSARSDDDRITRVGAFLRKFRIDELPQLVNILKGDMSVVGPRPEMLANVDKYTSALPEFAYRNRVKAGLTGYAQIAGKYNTSPREKLMMDISYIENYSFWLDIKLILKTLTVFFKQDSTEAFSEEAPAEEKRDEAV